MRIKYVLYKWINDKFIYEYAVATHDKYHFDIKIDRDKGYRTVTTGYSEETLNEVCEELNKLSKLTEGVL